MERRLLERLIGAGVLVVALVIVVPAILDGGSNNTGNGDGEVSRAVRGEPAGSSPVNAPRRTHTIRLDQRTQSPPVARAVTQSAAGQAPTATPKVEQLAVVHPRPATPTRAAPKSPRIPDSPPDRPASAPETGWVVQLGSFSSKQNAQRLANEVGGRGFPVFLMSLNRSGKKLYRVRVGPLKTREQATELAGRLAKAGYSGQVTQ